MTGVLIKGGRLDTEMHRRKTMRHREKTAAHKLRREARNRSSFTGLGRNDTSVAGFQPPGLLLKPHSLWFFARVALGNSQSTYISICSIRILRHRNKMTGKAPGAPRRQGQAAGPPAGGTRPCLSPSGRTAKVWLEQEAGRPGAEPPMERS